MTTNKRKKHTRARGSHTHGGGSMKKRRGAGHRGGRGNSGSGKRGDSKKPSNWKNKDYFGKKGFVSITKKNVSALNLTLINQKIDFWAKEGLAEKKGSEYTLHIKKLGYNKLLGAGKITQKVTIHAEQASQKAIEKTESAGGKVILPSN